MVSVSGAELLSVWVGAVARSGTVRVRASRLRIVLAGFPS